MQQPEKLLCQRFNRVPTLGRPTLIRDSGAPGSNIVIDDAIGGAWYALNGDANGVAGSDLKSAGWPVHNGWRDLHGDVYPDLH